MHYTFIFNPAAGHRRAEQKRERMEAMLNSLGLDYQFVLTEAPRHAVELARNAAMYSDVVVAVGGDGTVQEVAEGVVASGEPVRLAVVPAGTGNDFVRMLRIPQNTWQAVQALPTLKPHTMDYGVVRCWEGIDPVTRVFVNAVGMGIDAEVAGRAPRFKVIPGIAGYLVTVLNTLATWKWPDATIEVRENGTATHRLYEGTLTLATAGNGVSSGGGFLLTPEADARDGLIDLLIAVGITRFRALQLIPLAMLGKHLNEPEISIDRLKNVVLTSVSGLPVHADGEVLARKAHRVEIDLEPSGLTVMMGDR